MFTESASEMEAFIQSVVDNPEDDTTRMVFADWLDDHDLCPRSAKLFRDHSAVLSVYAIDEFSDNPDGPSEYHEEDPEWIYEPFAGVLRIMRRSRARPADTVFPSHSDDQLEVPDLVTPWRMSNRQVWMTVGTFGSRPRQFRWFRDVFTIGPPRELVVFPGLYLYTLYRAVTPPGV